MDRVTTSVDSSRHIRTRIISDKARYPIIEDIAYAGVLGSNIGQRYAVSEQPAVFDTRLIVVVNVARLVVEALLIKGLELAIAH